MTLKGFAGGADGKVEVFTLAWRPIEQLDGVISWLELRCAADQGEIAIDDAVVARCPVVGRIALNPGRRRITAAPPHLPKCETTADFLPHGRFVFGVAGAR